MQLQKPVMTLTMLFNAGAVAYKFDPNVGKPNCAEIAPQDSSLANLDCTTTRYLNYCNQMCSAQGNDETF